MTWRLRGSEAGGDLDTTLLAFVMYMWLALKHDLNSKGNEVCIRAEQGHLQPRYKGQVIDLTLTS